MSHFEPPIHWNDHEDIAMKLYERFGDDFTEAKIYRIRFTDLLEWILEIPGFEGTRAPGCTNGETTKNKILEKFSLINTFVLDVDGVLTDGSLLVMPNGLMARRMNIKDGYALQLAVKKGYRVIIISGGHSPEG